MINSVNLHFILKLLAFKFPSFFKLNKGWDQSFEIWLLSYTLGSKPNLFNINFISVLRILVIKVCFNNHIAFTSEQMLLILGLKSSDEAFTPMKSLFRQNSNLFLQTQGSIFCESSEGGIRVWASILYWSISCMSMDDIHYLNRQFSDVFKIAEKKKR